MTLATPGKNGKVYYGWWITLILAIISIYGNGIYYYGFSTFVKPIVKELAWSMAVVSGAFSIYRLEAGIAAPVVGYLLDRIGPRQLVFSGGLIMGGGFIYLSYVHTPLHFYIAIITISCGWSACAGAACCNPLIGKWFVKKRGHVIGLYNAAIGLAGLLVPGVAYLIAHYGWRATLLMMGPLTWLMVLPLSFFLKHSPEQCGLLPDGEPFPPAGDADRQKGGTTAAGDIDFSLRDAMATSGFWILTVCFFMNQITQASVFVHLIPYLIDQGIDATSAASIITFIVLLSSLGRYGFGWLGDRFDKKWLLVLLFIMQPIAILLLTRAHVLVNVIPFVLLYAISYGGIIVVRATITGDFYGRHHYGKIFGTLQGFSTLGGIAGPVLTGFVYDVTGSYRLAFIAFAAMMGLTGLMISILRRPLPARST
ncbi:MAG: MFS transporter [Deltaproteobacteria bacterium]|nr:MFS transporter [Deltaproteobacteria bacterium]